MNNLFRVGTWRLRLGFAAPALALTCLIVSMGAFAQSVSPISSVSSVISTACAHAATPPGSVSRDVDQFRRLSADEQAASLRTRIENHSLLSLTDAQILSLMDAMKPEAFVAYARADMVLDNDYEYSMFRQERVSGRWSDRPDHMLIRYQDNPRKVYAKWLPDGGHAGQEILYDETRIASTATRAVCCVSCRARSQWMGRLRMPNPAIACAILVCSSSPAPSIMTLAAFVKRVLLRSRPVLN
jgi:hypothetical protein